MGCGASVVAPAQQDANQDPRRVRQRIKLEPGGENAQLSSRSLERKLQSRVIERNASERKDGKHGNNNASQIHILLLGAGDSGKTTLFKQLVWLYGRQPTDHDRINYKRAVSYTLITAMKQLCVLIRRHALTALATGEISQLSTSFTSSSNYSTTSGSQQYVSGSNIHLNSTSTNPSTSIVISTTSTSSPTIVARRNPSVLPTHNERGHADHHQSMSDAPWNTPTMRPTQANRGEMGIGEALNGVNNGVYNIARSSSTSSPTASSSSSPSPSSPSSPSFSSSPISSSGYGIIHGHGKPSMNTSKDLILLSDYLVPDQPWTPSMGIPHPNYGLRPDALLSFRAVSNLTGFEDMTPELGYHMLKLWQDSQVQKTIHDYPSELPDNTAYFVARIPALVRPEYVPSVMDVVNTRVRTTGIVTEEVNIGGTRATVYDVGGQRAERSKWRRCYKAASAVIFVVSSACFDMTLHEDDRVNRLAESLNVFEDVCNDPALAHSAIILFLSKADILDDKLRMYKRKYITRGRKIPQLATLAAVCNSPPDIVTKLSSPDVSPTTVFECLRIAFDARLTSHSRLMFAHVITAVETASVRSAVESTRDFIVEHVANQAHDLR